MVEYQQEKFDEKKEIVTKIFPFTEGQPAWIINMIYEISNI